MHQDPNVQLEQLRKNSLMGPGDLEASGKRVIPDRQMVTHHLERVDEAPPSKEVSAPVFSEPDFGFSGTESHIEEKVDGTLAPTETAA